MLELQSECRKANACVGLSSFLEEEKAFVHTPVLRRKGEE